MGNRRRSFQRLSQQSLNKFPSTNLNLQEANRENKKINANKSLVDTSALP